MDSQGAEQHAALKPRTFLSDDELDNQLLIGVCGGQASGKTVFLTSVYQTIYRFNQGDEVIRPERVNAGGAAYFADRETEIRKTGHVSGNVSNKLARLLYSSPKLHGWYRDGELPVNLFDFPGGDFNRISDIRALKESELQPGELDKVQDIERYLQKCDGLIILIDSKCFMPGISPSEANPLNASVKFLVDDCRPPRSRPLAVVFTQRDRFSEDEAKEKEKIIKKLSSLKALIFDRFTWKPNQPATFDKPFARVKFITCYYLDKDANRPKLLSQDGNIWTDEAAVIFKEILDQALRNFKARYLKYKKGKMELKQYEDKKAKKEAATERNKKIKIFFVVLFLIALVTLGIRIGLEVYEKMEISQNDSFLVGVSKEISNGDVGKIGVEELNKLETILAGTTPATEEKLTDFRTGIYNNLDAAIESENFMFGADMKDNEEKYKGYLRILEKISKGDSPPPKRNYENVLKTRLDLLEWGRIQEKDIKLVNQVTKRLTLINKKLCSDSDPLITEAKTIYLAKKYLAQMAAASVLRLSENIRTREFMERLSPKMGKFQGTRIPYKITYNHFREFANNLRDYVALFAKMKAGIQNLEINSDEHAILMKTIMDRSLCDLSLLDKKKLAGSVIVALKAGSLFNNEGTQGVKGVRNTANLVFDKLQSRSRFNNYLLMNLFAKPFYLREIETLKALVGLRCYQYHAINALKLILTRMENGYSSETSLWDGMQERLEEFQPPKEKYLKDTRGLFYGHRKKYQRIKNRLEKWNESSGDDRVRILKEVKYYLSVLCKGTQKPGEGDCSDED